MSFLSNFVIINSFSGYYMIFLINKSSCACKKCLFFVKFKDFVGADEESFVKLINYLLLASSTGMSKA